MLALPRSTCLALASAYQLDRARVDEDAVSIQQWRDSETGLLHYLQQRHGWTAASEYAPYYVADVRRALLPFSTNGSATD